jgi:hypothetical protein
MSTTLIVPAEMVGHLRNGLHSSIGDAVQEIAHVVDMPDREQHPERYREPLEHFDAVRALLDLIGWGETDPPVEVSVDLREHRRALTDALQIALLAGNDDLEEAEAIDAQRARRAEPPKREATTRRVLALREFVAAVEAQVERSMAERGDV